MAENPPRADKSALGSAGRDKSAPTDGQIILLKVIIAPLHPPHSSHKIVSVSRRFCKNPTYTPGYTSTFNLQKQMVYFAYA